MIIFGASRRSEKLRTNLHTLWRPESSWVSLAHRRYPPWTPRPVDWRSNAVRSCRQRLRSRSSWRRRPTGGASRPRLGSGRGSPTVHPSSRSPAAALRPDPASSGCFEPESKCYNVHLKRNTKIGISLIAIKQGRCHRFILQYCLWLAQNACVAKMLSKANFPHVYNTLTKVHLVLTGP